MHRNQLDRRIRIRVAFSLDNDSIPNNGITLLGGELKAESTWLSLNLNIMKARSAWVEAITAWEESKGAYVEEYAAGLNDDELVRLRQFYGRGPKLVNVNADHAIVRETEHRLQPKPENAFLELCKRRWPVHERNPIIPEPDRPFFVDNSFFTTKSYDLVHSA